MGISGAGEGGDQALEILARFDRADVQNVRPVDGEARCNTLASGFHVAGHEVGVAAERDGAHFLLRRAEQFDHVAPRGRRVGDHAARLAHRLARRLDETPQRFRSQLGIAQQRQIVHGDDERNPGRPRQHVVRGMKDVDRARHEPRGTTRGSGSG